MSIDLDFRPTGYADFDDPVSLALNGIKGQMRREMVRDMLAAEGEKRALYDELLGPLDEHLLEERVPEERIQAVSRSLGPAWMGGEYLPDLAGREVEIARVVLASVLGDVFSVRACLVEGGYRYSMVDEYATDFRVTPKASPRTLTLGELIGLIDSVDDGVESPDGFVEAWWWQQWECGDAPERCTAFARVESEQYPQLAAHYEARARQWRIARAAEAAGRPGEER